MRRPLVLVLAFCLFHLQVGVVFAADKTADDPSNVLTVENESKKEDAESDEATAMTLSSLSIVASGIMGPMYVMWCSNMPSAWIYAATAGIYVGAEVISWGQYNKASDRIMKAYNNSNVKEQVESLEAAAKQTDEAAKAAKRKQLYAQLAAMGYTAAAAMAIYEGWPFNIPNPPGACAGGVSKNKNQINNFNFDTQKTSIAAIEKSSSDLNSYALFDELVRVANDEKSSSKLSEYNARKEVFSTTTSFGLKSGLLFAANQMGNLISPSAMANQQLEKMGIMLGLAGAAATAMWGGILVESMPPWIRAVSTSSVTRAVVFGAHAAITMVGATKIGEAQQKLAKRAGQYKMLAGQLKNMGNTNVVNNDATGGVAEVTPAQEVIAAQEDPAFTSVDSSTCFVSADNNETMVDTTCSCKKTNTCKKAMVPSTKFNGFSLPTGYNQALGALKSTGNSLYSGDYLKASTNAQSALGNAAMVGKVLKDSQKDLNDKLTKEGKKNYPFDKMEKKYAKMFNDGVSKSLQKMSPENAKRLLALASGPAGADENAADSDAKDGLKENKILTTAAKDQGSTGSSAASAKDKADPFAGVNFNFDETNKVAAKTQNKDSDDEYDYRKTEGEQIANKPDVSIFNLITVRYMKTAFPILFSESPKSE